MNIIQKILIILKMNYLEKKGKVYHKDLDDMVFRMGVTNDKIVEILDINHIAVSTKRYSLPPSIYEISDLNLKLTSLVSNELRVDIPVDGTRLKSI